MTLDDILTVAIGGTRSLYAKKQLEEDFLAANRKRNDDLLKAQADNAKWQFEQQQQLQKDGYIPIKQYADQFKGGDLPQTLSVPGVGTYARTYSQRLDQMKQEAEIASLKAGAAYHNAMAQSPFVSGKNIPAGFEVKSYDFAGRPTIGKTAAILAQEEAQSKALADEAVRQTKLAGLNDAINFFDKKINEIPVGTGAKGRLEGLGLEAQALTQMGPQGAKAAAYKADIEGMRSQIARGLGEVGNLAENEQKYAMRLLPRLTDNAETRAQKISNFKEYVASRTQRRTSSVSTKSESTTDNDPLGIR